MYPCPPCGPEAGQWLSAGLAAESAGHVAKRKCRDPCSKYLGILRECEHSVVTWGSLPGAGPPTWNPQDTGRRPQPHPTAAYSPLWPVIQTDRLSAWTAQGQMARAAQCHVSKWPGGWGYTTLPLGWEGHHNTLARASKARPCHTHLGGDLRALPSPPVHGQRLAAAPHTPCDR